MFHFDNNHVTKEEAIGHNYPHQTIKKKTNLVGKELMECYYLTIITRSSRT